MKQETLPFTVRPVQDMNDLTKAIEARYMAYDRHVPALAARLKDVEATDTEDGVLVLLAESKLDGTALGTMRIQTNQFGPLAIEDSIALPSRFQGQKLAEATRLGVENGKIGLLVKLALFKACYQYCKMIEVDHLVIAGRAPLDRLYQRWLFQDVFPGGGYFALSHVNNIPHRIMSADLHTSQASWESAKHPLLEFMTGTIHLDLEFDPTLVPRGMYAEAAWRAFPPVPRPMAAHAFQAH
jgi:hypothetical protein